eukprot:3431271-Pleurochrysis_carterae.AAC.1
MSMPGEGHACYMGLASQFRDTQHEQTCGSHLPAMLDLLFGFPFPGVPLLAVAGRVIVRLSVVAAAGPAAGRGLCFLDRRTTLARVLGGRATA